MKRTAHPYQFLQIWLLQSTSFLLPSEVFAVSLGNSPLDHIEMAIRDNNEPCRIYKVLDRKGTPKNERVRTLQA